MKGRRWGRYKNPNPKRSVDHGKDLDFLISDGKSLKSFNQGCDVT